MSVEAAATVRPGLQRHGLYTHVGKQVHRRLLHPASVGVVQLVRSWLASRPQDHWIAPSGEDERAAGCSVQRQLVCRRSRSESASVP